MIGPKVTPDGSTVYVANAGGASNSVSVIDTATNAVSATITDPSFSLPIAFGIFIQQPALTFAGAPGQANCNGQTVSALAKKYGGLDAAAKTQGCPSVAGAQECDSGVLREVTASAPLSV
jgi:YVTN family beta-propeller protein